MASLTMRRVQGAQWWVVVATVGITPLVFSRWTFDVFNVTELTALWIGAVAAAALRLATLLSGERLRLPALWPWVAFYLAVLCLTTATSRAPVVSLFGYYGRLGGLATSLAVIAVAFFLWERMAGVSRRQHQLAIAVLVSATLGSVYLVFQELGIDIANWVESDGAEPAHAPGLLGNANFSGAHAALGVGPAAWLAANAGRRERVLWLSLLLACLAGTAVSQSRGAMLAAGITLLASAWFLRLPARRLAAAAAVVIALTGVVALATTNNGAGELVDPTTSDERLDLWTVALRGAPDHLVLGGGPDLYVVTFSEHAGDELAGVIADEPHNVLLDHLDGSGLLGAAAWLALVAAVVVTARGADRRIVTPWVLMGTTYLVQAMGSIDAVPLLLWGWVALAGIAAAASDRPSEPTPDRRVGVAALAFALVVLVAGTWVAVQPFRADMAYRRGIEASNAGNTAEATEQFQQAIDRHRWEPRYHSRLGLELWGTADLRDPDQVLAIRNALDDALELFPDDPRATAWRAGVDAQVAALSG